MRGGRPVALTTLSLSLSLSLLSSSSSAARILAVQPIAARSHWNFMAGVLRALSAAGHDVTVYTPFAADAGRDVAGRVVDTSDELVALTDVDPATLSATLGDPVGTAVPLLANSRRICDRLIGGRLKTLLDGGGGGGGGGRLFDAVVVEIMSAECMGHVADRLAAPLVYVRPSPFLGPMERAATGHASNPAAVSGLMAGHGSPTTFARRLSNAVQSALVAVARAAAEPWLAATGPPRPYDLRPPVKPSMVFVNSHWPVDLARPVAGNVVNVGGVHLKPPRNLPQDILEFIEESAHGVIYFSFGSTVKMSAIPERVRKAFIEALAQVPQRVLLKYENEMDDKPRNVMTRKWLPQRDILVHPNVRLFISHGGVSGLYEALDAGVPILGFPVFFDQTRNVDNLVSAGMAISMDLWSASKQVFLKNVLELLNNENYTRNAKTASEIFKDRPMSPAQSVVYWTEYVIRHAGAPHLKSSALDLAWYQYYLLDVISATLAIVFATIFVCRAAFRSARKRYANMDSRRRR